MAITTKAALADELGITRARVSQYVKAGLPVRADGKLNRDDALNWIARTQSSRTFEDKGAHRARKLSQRDRLKPKAATRPTRTPKANSDTPVDIAARMALLHLLRPHAEIVAAAVLEAGGSVEVAYATAHLIHSPLIEAAGLALQAMGHPAFQGDDHDLQVPAGWPFEPDWAALAAAAGVGYEPARLRRYLDENPVWAARGNENGRRFQRDLTLSDIAVTGAAHG